MRHLLRHLFPSTFPFTLCQFHRGPLQLLHHDIVFLNQLPYLIIQFPGQFLVRPINPHFFKLVNDHTHVPRNIIGQDKSERYTKQKQHDIQQNQLFQKL
ncbi:MAG: Uncharacterised protein [Cryomorphaceae bacterium]|nr:MAG: Uncharacterised protein [Cryomorphaceae bacterium]